MVYYQVDTKEEGTYSLTYSHMYHDFECLQANPKGLAVLGSVHAVQV